MDEGGRRDSTFRSMAFRLRADLRDGRVTPERFRAAIDAITPEARDAWLDVVWEAEEVPPDDPSLPRGCVPYLPSPVSAVLAAVDRAAVTAEDVFVDVGSGLGRAAFLVHSCTGARTVGVEIQPFLARAARARSDGLRLSRLQFFEGDAADWPPPLRAGTVFFLYCPFGADRLARFLDGLEGAARSGPIRVCTVDMPPLGRDWLVQAPSPSLQVDVYQSAPPRA